MGLAPSHWMKNVGGQDMDAFIDDPPKKKRWDGRTGLGGKKRKIENATDLEIYLAVLAEGGRRAQTQGPDKEEWFRDRFQVTRARDPMIMGFTKVLNNVMNYISKGRGADGLMLSFAIRDGKIDKKKLRTVAASLLTKPGFIEVGQTPSSVARSVAATLYSMYLDGDL